MVQNHHLGALMVTSICLRAANQLMTVNNVGEDIIVRDSKSWCHVQVECTVIQVHQILHPFQTKAIMLHKDQTNSMNVLVVHTMIKLVRHCANLVKLVTTAILPRL